jgi:aspartate kinase
MTEATPVVIKIGGSVLTGPKAYARAARWLARRWRGPEGFRAPLLAIVSAENGVTDRLLDEARAISASPDSRALDLLWATGEQRSAALLALHLQALCIPACALNAHETGLHHTRGALGVRTRHLRRALESHAIVVAPGFLASTPSRSIVTLGRGGSDLSAVALAAALGARSCELIKDVPGYFTADPARVPSAVHIPRIHIDAAIAMADAGCDLVQASALRSARCHGIELHITTAGDDARHTTVTIQGEENAIRYEDDSRRAAVGA